MPGQNIIELGWDVDNFSEEQKVIVTGMTEVYEAAQKLDGLKLSFGNASGFGQLNQALAQQRTALDGIAQATQNYSKILADNLAAQAEAAKRSKATKQGADDERAALERLAAEGGKRVKAQEALNSGLLEQQALTRDRVKALKQEAAATSELLDPYSRLVAQAAQAETTFRNAAAQYGVNSEEAQGYMKVAKALRDELFEIRSSIGDHGLNVGNYISALGGLKVIVPMLDTIRAQMAEMAAAGKQDTAAYQALAKQAQTLEVVITQQERGFSSLNQEIRANEFALQSLREAGLEGSQGFKELRAEVVKAHQELNEFTRAQRLLESEAPTITALTTLAKGLGGAYAVSAGAASLFADGDEKVEKELQKLVAIMTILQGLEEADAFFKKRVEIGTILWTAAQRGLSAVMGIWNFILTGSIRTQEAATAATEANTGVLLQNSLAQESAAAAAEESVAVTEGQIAVQEAQAAATEAQTAATEAATVAQEGLNAAAIAGRAALVLTGIGALVVGILAMAQAWHSAADEEKEADEALEKLYEDQKKYNELLVASVTADDKYNSSRKEQLERQLAQAQAAGESEVKLFALRKSIAEEEKKLADDQVAKLQTNVDKQGQLFSQLQTARAEAATSLQRSQEIQGKLNEVEENKPSLLDSYAYGEYQRQKKTLELQQESADENTKIKQAEVDKLQGIYEAGEAALKRQADATKEINDNQLEHDKFTTAQRVKLAQTLETLRSQAIIDMNDRVLASDKSSEEERLAALKSSLAARKNIIEANRTAALAAPGLSKEDRSGIKASAEAEKTKAETESEDAIFNLRQEYRQREIQAQYDFFKAEIGAQAEADQKEMNNTENNLRDRLAALYDYQAKRKALIDADINNQIAKNPNMLPSERSSLEESRTTQKNTVDTESRQQANDITRSSLASDASRTNTGIEIVGLNQELDALQKLNKEYEDGTITLKEYNKEKDKLNDAIQLQTLEAQTNVLREQDALLKKKGLDDLEVTKQIAANQVAIEKLKNKDIASADADLDAKKKQLQSEEEQLVIQSTDLIFSLQDDAIERQKNALAQRTKELDKSYQVEVANIQKSSLSEQQKAEQVQLLDAETNAQRLQFSNEQKRLDQERAKNDKAAALAKAIEGTAVAVVNAAQTQPVWLGIAMAAVVGALGAVQIAKIAATPVPQYADGTENHPGGMAIVGEGRYKELVEPAGGQPFIADHTMLLNLSKGSKVTPVTDGQIDNAMYSAMMRSTAGIYGYGSDRTAIAVASMQKDMNEKLDALISAQGGRKQTTVKVYNDARFQARIDHQIFGRS